MSTSIASEPENDPGARKGWARPREAGVKCLRTGNSCRLVLALALVGVGCAKIGTSAAGNAGSGGSGHPNSPGNGGGLAQGGLDAAMPPDGGAPDGAIPDRVFVSSDLISSEPMACATQSAMAETLPLDLYVMMDSSLSMLDPTAAGNSKWQAVQAAMLAFINDRASAGLGVGLQYFPQVQPNAVAECNVDKDCGAYGPCDRLRVCAGPKTTDPITCATNSDCKTGETCVLIGACLVFGNLCVPAGATCTLGDPCTAIGGNCRGRDRCDVAAYATPAVPIATLPGAAAALTASLNMHQPDGLTPTAAALSGALQTAKARATANPGRKVAVLLVTDGLPTECPPVDVPGVAALAKTAATAAPAIPTFVIGVFTPDDAATATTNLNLLAQGGGTGAAVVINTNQDVTQALQSALNQIRTTAVACEFKIPPATNGALDFGKVNVQLTSSVGAPATIGHVPGVTSCDPTRGGWYYDVDPSTGGTPTTIRACDASCAQFRAATAARVDIVFGCPTVIIL